MTGKTLIYIVGTRCVKLSGNDIRGSYRREGARILKDFLSHKGDVSLELFDPLLGKFRSDISKVVLVATDQENPQYREKDTIHFAEIIRELRQDKSLPFELRLFKKNPSDPEEAFTFFRSLYSELSGDGLIVSQSGGTPQMNAAAFIVGSLLYPQTTFYQVDQEGHVSRMPRDETISRDLFRRICSDLVQRWRYAEALEFGRQLGVLDNNIEKLLLAGHHRLLFDFNSSENNWNSWEIPETPEEKLAECAHNVLVRWDQEEYADFAARLYRFLDGSLQVLFDRAYGSHVQWEDESKKNVEFNEILEKHGVIQKVKTECGRRHLSADAVPLSKAIKVGCREGKAHLDTDGDEGRKLIGNLNSKIVHRLRHKSFIGHGFGAVTHGDIVEKVSDPVKSIRHVCALLKIPLGSVEEKFGDLNSVIQSDLTRATPAPSNSASIASSSRRSPAASPRKISLS